MGKLNRRQKIIYNVAAVALLSIFYLVVLSLVNKKVLVPYDLQILSLICINIMLAVSLNLINGFTGLFSIGHAGFFGIGAYLSAYCTVYYHIPFGFALLFGGIFAAFIGICIGLPTLRLRGDYLAIATLGFSEIIRVVILNIPSIGGAQGLYGISRKTSFGSAYLLMVVSIIIIKNFIESTHGRACIAIKEDEIASESLGINSTYYKVMSFAIGSFFAGVAGGLYSHYLQYINPASIGFMKSVDILIMVVLGGLGSLTGSVLAAILLTLLPEVLRSLAEYRMVVYPLVLIITMLFRPSGLLGGKELSFAFIHKYVNKIFGSTKKHKRMTSNDA